MLTCFQGRNVRQDAVYVLLVRLDEHPGQSVSACHAFDVLFGSDVMQLGPYMSLMGFSRGIVLIVLMPSKSGR